MFGDGEWHADGSVVIDKYTQTRQRWLKAKIVKFGHGRHYKEALAVYRKGDTTTTVSTTVFENLKTRK